MQQIQTINKFVFVYCEITYGLISLLYIKGGGVGVVSLI